MLSLPPLPSLSWALYLLGFFLRTDNGHKTFLFSPLWSNSSSSRKITAIRNTLPLTPLLLSANKSLLFLFVLASASFLWTDDKDSRERKLPHIVFPMLLEQSGLQTGRPAITRHELRLVHVQGVDTFLEEAGCREQKLGNTLLSSLQFVVMCTNRDRRKLRPQTKQH